VKLLGIDPGERWVGLALSDETGTLASPYGTIDRNEQDVNKQLAELIRQKSIDRIIVGFPRPLKTDTNERTRKVDEFIETIIQPLSVPHETVSERYTTKEARRLREQRDDNPSSASDAEAAALILQHYIDSGDSIPVSDTTSP
jgi:putative Holliday junction resolvase